MKKFVALSFVAVFGCATAMPPADLVTARNTYERASHGPTADVDPTDLHTAKLSLDAAERSFVDDGDTLKTRDLAYTADRLTQVAESHARAMQADQQKGNVVNQMNANQAAAARDTTNALRGANQQLAAQAQTINTQGQQALAKDQQLKAEQDRRMDAEKRAAQALLDLQHLATSVKQEPRGLVITLSGSVLFASAKSDLLPDAQVKLNDVAKALLAEDPDSKMVIEGHTDSQGAAAFNQDLSQKRAEAVRNYLVSRGISGDRITSQGFGSTRSISDNNTAEGRANNRRVEIVIQKK